MIGLKKIDIYIYQFFSINHELKYDDDNDDGLEELMMRY